MIIIVTIIIINGIELQSLNECVCVCVCVCVGVCVCVCVCVCVGGGGVCVCLWFYLMTPRSPLLQDDWRRKGESDD